jgi:hypothetical protein
MEPLAFLWQWPLPRLEALYRVAKTTPFFRDPRNMRYLRDVLYAKQSGQAKRSGA